MSGSDLRQISLGLYQYLSRHIVGTEDTVRTKRRWNTLRDKLVSYRNNFKVITSGSFGEGLDMKGSDFDLMNVIQDVVVFEEINEIQVDPDKAAYFQILTDDTKLGFVKLLHIRSADNKHDKYNPLCQKIGTDFYLSSAILKEHFFKFLQLVGLSELAEKIHGPCLSDKEGRHDIAFCFHCSSWISQANHWRSRSNNAWPSNETKARIIEHGVLFVPIGVKGSFNEDLQWRISFSVGEKLLIYSFTHTQLTCYALMKIVLKDLINTDPECEDLLCSYFIKNIMLWLSEELPLSIWRPDNLIPCFVRCLERLIYCVEYSMCVHYFIPENNMFENRIEGEKRDILLTKLRELFTLKWKCILESPQLKKFNAYNLNIEAHLFDVHFEQVMNSKTIQKFEYKYDMSVAYPIRLVQTSRSPLIRRSIIRILSEMCYSKAQRVQLCNTFNNKKLYRQYKTCQYYLMQSLYHNTVSGWLMVASLFFRMKQYHKTLNVVLNALQKCSPEKVSIGTEITTVLRDVLKSKTITDMGLEKALSIFFVSELSFFKRSQLILNELESDSTYSSRYILPPVVYGHFLSFLCHYYLHDTRQCRDSIRDMRLAIDQEYFMIDKLSKAAALSFLGVAFQLIGDIKSAKEVFCHAIRLDTKFNCAEQRMIKLL